MISDHRVGTLYGNIDALKFSAFNHHLIFVEPKLSAGYPTRRSPSTVRHKDGGKVTPSNLECSLLCPTHIAQLKGDFILTENARGRKVFSHVRVVESWTRTCQYSWHRFCRHIVWVDVKLVEHMSYTYCIARLPADGLIAFRLATKIYWWI